jgi:hypothetical protein
VSSSILLSIFSDAQSIISIITSIIDIFAIVVIAITVFTTILPLIKNSIASSLPFVVKSSSDRQAATENYMLRRKLIKENLIKGLLLALELESANAILKMGIFTSGLVGISTTSSSASTFSINSFVFFVGIFSLRIALNRTLRRTK